MSKHHKIVWPLAPGEWGALHLVPALVVRASAHSIMLALVCWTSLGGKKHGEDWGWDFSLSFIWSLEVQI